MPQLLLNCQGSLGLRHATKAWNVLPNSHFGTNDPVQECQIPGVRTFIRNARSRKSRLDEKIASLEAALNELYSERDALDEAICNHVVALSPIRRMPTEILSLIFSLVLANDVKFDYRVDSAPWTLIAVCACWRSVALSPIFWTRISNWQRHFSLEKLEVILNRTVVSRGNENAGTSSSALRAVGAPVIQGSQEIYSALERAGPRFPMLRTLEVEIYYPDDIPAPHTLDIFSHASQLQKATVNLAYWTNPVILDLPWNQLSTYRSSFEWNGLSALALAVNLVECSLDMGDGLEPAIKDVTVMQFPRLQRLSVSHRGILAYLDTPVLQELYYHDSDPAKSVNSLDFFRALPRTLQTLVFEAHIETEEGFDLIDILGALPRMRSFTLSTPFPADVVCKFLASASERVPLLESVSLGLPTKSEHRILNTLEALDWADNDRRLRTFRFLVEKCQTTSAILPRLNSFKAQDASVEFGDGDYQFWVSTVPARFRFQR